MIIHTAANSFKDHQGIFYLMVCLAICISCGQHNEHVQEPSGGRLPQAQSISLGTPTKLKGKEVAPSDRKSPATFKLSSQGRQKIISANVKPLQVGSEKSFPRQLPNLFPQDQAQVTPITRQITGKEVLVHQPIPTPAKPLQRKEESTHNLRYLDAYQGLKSPSVYSMLEDDRGFIWIGTLGGGVSRYDGRNFLHFTQENGLSHNVVKCMLQDSRENLWIGTLGGGLNLYDGNKFTHFTAEEGLANTYILSLLEDKSGNIWVGTDDGVFILRENESGFELSSFANMKDMAFLNMLSMMEDREGNIWMGTWDGVLRYSPSGKNGLAGEFHYFSPSEGLFGKSVFALLEDSKGNIWLGTKEQGLTVYNPVENTLRNIDTQQGLAHSSVYDMLEDREGNLWFAFDGGGVNKLSLEGNGNSISGKFFSFNTSNGLSHDNVLSLLEDSGGNIWMGTWSGGLNQYKSNGLEHITSLSGLPSNDVRAILEDQEDNLWLGTWGQGIIQIRENNNEEGRKVLNSFTQREGLSSDNVLALEEDLDGNLWIGTGGGGITYFDRAENQFSHIAGEEGLSGYGVNSILADSKGNIWAGTDGNGLSLIESPGQEDKRTFTHFTNKEGFVHERIFATAEDNEGNIWLGTETGAVCYVPGPEPSEGIYYTLTTENGLKNNYVVSILCDPQGKVWIGTRGGGLHEFIPEKGSKGGIIRHYSIENGLNNDWVMAIAAEKSGNIWVNTLEGFTVLMPEQGQQEVSQGLDRYFPLSLGDEDGLVRTGFWWNNILLDHKQRLWWGVRQGVSELDLREFAFKESEPRISLQTIQINQQFVDYSNGQLVRENESSSIREMFQDQTMVPFANYPEGLELPYDYNHLTFHVNAIDWTAPQKVQYLFEMDGPGGTQQVLSNETWVDYRNLPYGDHRFRVRAIGASRIWSETFEYAFTIRPPWWHTWWARLMYLLLALSAIYAVYQYQLRRRLAIEETKRLKELDEFKTQFFTNISHEFRTPITVIMGMAKRIRGHERHKGLIARNSDRLLQLVNQLLDLSKLESGHRPLKLVQQDIIPFLNYLTQAFFSLADEKDIELGFHSTMHELLMDFDPESIQQIMTNLLSNALKFTPRAGFVKVLVTTHERELEKWIQIAVQDNGPGIPPAEIEHIFDRFYQSQHNQQKGGTGIGLALVKELSEQMGGSIQVNSATGKGTTFLIQLPIRQSAPRSENSSIQALPDLPQMEEQSEQAEGSPSKLARILIIEDNLDVCTYIEACIGTTYQVLLAHDGEAGLEAAFEFVPDLIITDVMMPKKDGYEVCKILKTNRATSHIPVIMLTAKARDEERLEGLQHGADVYLVKPFQEAELHLRIHNLLELQQSWRDRFQQSDVSLPAKSQNIEDQFIKESREAILAQLDNTDYDVEQFSKDMALSRAQLHRKLKALTGMSATKFINDIRLTEAHNLLLKGELQVAEVAYSTGFEYPNYFAKLYKQKFGQAPSATGEGTQ